MGFLLILIAIFDIVAGALFLFVGPPMKVQMSAAAAFLAGLGFISFGFCCFGLALILDVLQQLRGAK